jgi:hypothetical protein
VTRTAVLHPGALGDVLLAVPALRALRASAPGHELVLAAQPRIGALLAALGAVDRALDFDALGLHALFTAGAPSEASRDLLSGARVVSWFGSRDADFAGRLRSLTAECVVAPSVPADGGTVWRHLLASVAALSNDTASAEAPRDPIVLDDDLAHPGSRALAAAGWDGARPLAIVHPGAGGVDKRWRVEGFARVAEALVDALGASVVVHEGPADGDAAAALRRHLCVPALALVDPPLPVLAGAIRHAALWIGNDSGVTHLAAAVGTPALALFVAANLAWRPWSPAARVRAVSVDSLLDADVDAVIGDATDLWRSRSRASLARSRR